MRWDRITALTCANHFVNSYTGSIQLFGKLMYCLTRVLIRVGIHVRPESWEPHYKWGKGHY